MSDFLQFVWSALTERDPHNGGNLLGLAAFAVLCLLAGAFTRLVIAAVRQTPRLDRLSELTDVDSSPRAPYWPLPAPLIVDASAPFTRRRPWWRKLRQTL